MRKILKKHSHLLHKLGMGLSLLCAIHCLAMPFVLVALPLIGGEFFSETNEIILMLISILLGLNILLKDRKIHESYVPLGLLILSASLILLHAVSILPFHTHFLLTIGSVLMALAYFINWRMHKSVCSHS